MKIQGTSLGLALCVALSCVVPTLSQTSDITGAATPATVAFVYVQTAKGINLYNATAAGKLTLVKGSPFQPSGPGQTMIGSNGKFLVTLGANDLHAYPVAANGTIGKQVSQTDARNYGGAECTGGVVSPISGEMSPTGKAIYVFPGPDLASGCNYYYLQTYSTSKTGEFVFIGDTEVDPDTPEYVYSSLPFMIGNGKFGYGFDFSELDCWPDAGVGLEDIYVPSKQGALEFKGSNLSIKITSPPPDESYWSIGSLNLASDSADHLAIELHSYSGYCDDGGGTLAYGPIQLASFTADSHGNLNTSNTYLEMPVLSGYAGVMTISPSSKILAVAIGSGIQFFHFNGAAPITKFTGIVGTSGSITAMQWDHSNHLYAINGASGNVHVYTVTTTSVVEAPGSPYAANSSGGLVVVSK